MGNDSGQASWRNAKRLTLRSARAQKSQFATEELSTAMVTRAYADGRGPGAASTRALLVTKVPGGSSVAMHLCGELPTIARIAIR